MGPERLPLSPSSQSCPEQTLRGERGSLLPQAQPLPTSALYFFGDTLTPSLQGSPQQQPPQVLLGA